MDGHSMFKHEPVNTLKAMADSFITRDYLINSTAQPCKCHGKIWILQDGSLA